MHYHFNSRLIGVCSECLFARVATHVGAHWNREGSRFVVLRVTCFSWVYSIAQVYGILAYTCIRIWFVFRPRECTDALYALQTQWTSLLFWGAGVLLSMKLHVSGNEALVGGPVTLLFRHSSLVDTLLPGVCVAKNTPLRLRYILKKELLWDPCLDLVGNYLPNYFVDRNGDANREGRNITRLSSSLGPNDAVLIYPEGTRFSEGKRQRLIDRWTQSSDSRATMAVEWTHVLPPKTKGVWAIRQGCPEADVVFCAHAGLERVTNIRTLLAAATHGITVHVFFWRVAHTDVPQEEHAQQDWLFQQWALMNQEVARLKNTNGTRPL